MCKSICEENDFLVDPMYMEYRKDYMCKCYKKVNIPPYIALCSNK